ncbi:unnamed protein product [Urochloa humidicola]
MRSSTTNRKLLQGECSKVRETSTNHSTSTQTKSRPWNSEQRNKKQNPSSRSHQASLQCSEHLDEQGYQLVRPAYWWRKSNEHSRKVARHHQPQGEDQRRERYLAHVKGKCLNCFSTEHKVAECRYNTKCWRCLRMGHKAYYCPDRQGQFKRTEAEREHQTLPSSTAPPPPPRNSTASAVRSAGRSYLQAARGEPAAMATYPGDPRARPELAICTIAATGPIKHKREVLIGKTAVCWVSGNSHDTTPHHVVEALDEQLHISPHDIKVVKHFPEQYLIFFADSRAYHHALNHRDVRNRGRTFSFDPWTERRNAVVNKLEFRVCLRIEGMPPHAWSEEVAAKVIGQHCAIHFVEGSSRRQDRTRTYDLWAWSSNPSRIPKKVLLTITDPDRELAAGDAVDLHHDPPRGFKGALDYKLHIHLDVVEDLSFLGGGGGREALHNRKQRREFLWNYGALDSLGERRSGQGHDNHTGRNYHPRHDRDDHDDNYHWDVRRHHRQSSWGRMTRCRGTVDDCYSSTHYRGSNHGSTGHRSRALTPTGHQTTWRKKAASGKKVSFANPLVQVMGQCRQSTDQSSFLVVDVPSARQTAWFDPMLEETLIDPNYVGNPSKERRILDMLGAAPGWCPASPSPMDEARMEAGEMEHTDIINNATRQSSYSEPAKHLPQPLTAGTMNAIQTLVEHGNQPRNKKRSKKIVPALAEAQLAQVA